MANPFNTKEQFHFKQFTLIKQFYFKQFSLALVPSLNFKTQLSSILLFDWAISGVTISGQN